MSATDEKIESQPAHPAESHVLQGVVPTESLREHVETLVDEELWGQLHSLLADLPPADIAQLIAHYQEPILSSIFKGLPDDLKPDVLAELPTDAASELAAALPAPAAADIANEMAPDDAADVLGELDKEISSKIIEGMDQETADEVRKLMTYPETSAGGIMTTDLLRLDKNQTVLEALDAIATNPDDEHIYQVYITDADGILIGTVSIWELLHQRDRLRPLDHDRHTLPQNRLVGGEVPRALAQHGQLGRRRGRCRLQKRENTLFGHELPSFHDKQHVVALPVRGFEQQHVVAARNAAPQAGRKA